MIFGDYKNKKTELVIAQILRRLLEKIKWGDYYE